MSKKYIFAKIFYLSNNWQYAAIKSIFIFKSLFISYIIKFICLDKFELIKMQMSQSH